MVRRRGMLWIAMVALLAGCVAPRATAAPKATAAPARDFQTWLHQHAHDVLNRFDKAVDDASGSPRFVALGDLSEQEGGWRDDERDEQQAYLAGRIVAGTALPKTPRSGKVVWDDGETMPIPLISAGAALKQLVAEGNGSCPECTPLKVTVTFTMLGDRKTNRGLASIPAWLFVFDGTPFSVIRPAFVMSQVVRVDPMPWESVNLPGQPSPLPIDSATGSAAGRRLTVAFVGAKGPASQPCGIDYTTEAIESDYAVAVIMVEHHHSDHEACTMVGYPRTATVDLAQPLGDRAVLDTQQGLPVPLTITK